MITDEQRIFVCEKLLGWTPFNVKIDDDWSPEDGDYKVYYKDALGCEHRSLPPLTLDWIRECEEKLTREMDVNNYEEHLKTICGSYRRALHATATQRLAALVATLKTP